MICSFEFKYTVQLPYLLDEALFFLVVGGKNTDFSRLCGGAKQQQKRMEAFPPNLLSLCVILHIITLCVIIIKMKKCELVLTVQN